MVLSFLFYASSMFSVPLSLQKVSRFPENFESPSFSYDFIPSVPSSPVISALETRFSHALAWSLQSLLNLFQIASLRQIKKFVLVIVGCFFPLLK